MSTIPDRKVHPADSALSSKPSRAGWLILIFDSLWLVAMLTWTLFDPDAVLASIGAAAAWTTALPFVITKYSFLSPWSLMALTVHFGGLARSFYISLNPGFASRDVDQLFLLGHQSQYFVGTGLWYLAGIALTTLVYVLVSDRWGATIKISSVRLEFANSIIIPTVIFALIGFVAFVAYVQASGGFSLEQISAKRSVISGLEVGDDYQSHGVLRFLNSFGQVALWTYVGKTVYDNPKFSYISVRGFFIALLFINAAVLPFYSSSRSEVAFILIVVVAVDAGVRRHGPSRLAVFSGALITVAALVFMTNVRGTKDWLQDAQLDVIAGLEGLVVLNRNFGDFFTFTHVTRAVPDLLDWAWGSTIYGHLLAPIPRAIWPEKPLVSIGPLIGINVYGNERSGVPPGWFAEWYWNFGLVGFVIGAILFGFVLKLFSNMMRSSLWSNPIFVVFYCVVLFRFGYFAVGGGIGSSIFKMAMEAACLGTLLFICASFAGKGNRAPSEAVRAGKVDVD